MSELKRCPFCGGKNVLSTELQDGLPFIAYCQCGAENEAENWNTRPIEDALNARIAELEANNDRLQGAWFVEETICPDGSLKPKVSVLLSRIAELEAEVTKCHELQDSYCDRIAELEAAQRWIPVSERLPEPYTRVLACIKSGYMEVDYMYSEPIVDVGIADFNSLDNVTHWMPLPKLPEVQE